MTNPVTSTRKGKPVPRFTDATRPTPIRGCVCDDGGPLLVATFRAQNATTLAWEHRTYCPESNVMLDINAYLARGEKVPQ